METDWEIWGQQEEDQEKNQKEDKGELQEEHKVENHRLGQEEK